MSYLGVHGTTSFKFKVSFPRPELVTFGMKYKFVMLELDS